MLYNDRTRLTSVVMASTSALANVSERRGVSDDLPQEL